MTKFQEGNYNRVIIVNNIALPIWKLLKEDIFKVLKNIVIIWSERCVK